MDMSGTRASIHLFFHEYMTAYFFIKFRNTRKYANILSFYTFSPF